MYSIGDFLTTTNNDTGIKSLDVHYDSIFLNVVAFDDPPPSYYSHIIIDKLIWDYDLGSYISSKAGLIIDLGETSISDAACSQLIRTVLIAKIKKVLIFNLHKTDTSFIVNVFEYDINAHTVKKIYPLGDELTNWENGDLGELSPAQPPRIYVKDTDIDVLVGTTNTLKLFSFKYDQSINLSNTQSLSLDLPETIIIKTISRNSSNDLTMFYEKDGAIIPIVLDNSIINEPALV
jgi:hypothetical protein